MDLPQGLAEFLRQESLSPSGEPPVHLVVRLKAPNDMAEMIDSSGLRQLREGQHENEAIGYFIADRESMPARDAAQRMITDILRDALSMER